MTDYVDLCEPIKMSSKMYSYIEEKVVELFINLNITSFPIKPRQIAKKLGIKTKTYKKLGEELRNKLIKNEVYGFTYENKKSNVCIIAYEGTASNKRTRFTIMHEIGHYVLKHKEPSALAEKMADYFAGYALAPTPLMS